MATDKGKVNNTQQENELTIVQVSVKFGLSQAYVRNAIRNGKLETRFVPVRPGAKTTKHVIKLEEVEKWRKATGTRTRADGRTKYVMFATLEEFEQIKDWAGKNKIGISVERAHKPKSLPAPVDAAA